MTKQINSVASINRNGMVSNYEYIIASIKCILASFAGAILLFGYSAPPYQVAPVPIMENLLLYTFSAYIFTDAVFTVVRVMAKADKGE